MFQKSTCLTVALSFILSGISPIAQAGETVVLPVPGQMVALSPAFQPTLIKGMTIKKDNPFLFDFIVDPGQDKLSTDALKQETEKLARYFLASLAVPDNDLWVNLSPYEKNRIIPQALGQTEMGRDLLAQDYLLKQITSSLIYPEKELGKNFWDKVYSKIQAQHGNINIPVNTFNKVWIVGDRAKIYVHNNSAFVVDSHYKVMLEEDYLALNKNMSSPNVLVGDLGRGLDARQKISGMTSSINSQIIKDLIIPELEREVNQGKNFAQLRQISNALILASWYKNNLKEALLNQAYSNQSKVEGISLADKAMKQKIYTQYLEAYKKGVFNYIKDTPTHEGKPIPRKYFAGGFNAAMMAHPVAASPTEASQAMSANESWVSAGVRLTIPEKPAAANAAMVVIPGRMSIVVNGEEKFYSTTVLNKSIKLLLKTILPYTERKDYKAKAALTGQLIDQDSSETRSAIEALLSQLNDGRKADLSIDSNGVVSGSIQIQYVKDLKKWLEERQFDIEHPDHQPEQLRIIRMVDVDMVKRDDDQRWVAKEVTRALNYFIRDMYNWSERNGKVYFGLNRMPSGLIDAYMFLIPVIKAQTEFQIDFAENDRSFSFLYGDKDKFREWLNNQLDAIRNNSGSNAAMSSEQRFRSLGVGAANESDVRRKDRLILFLLNTINDIKKDVRRNRNVLDFNVEEMPQEEVDEIVVLLQKVVDSMNWALSRNIIGHIQIRKNPEADINGLEIDTMRQRLSTQRPAINYMPYPARNVRPITRAGSYTDKLNVKYLARLTAGDPTVVEDIYAEYQGSLRAGLGLSIEMKAWLVSMLANVPLAKDALDKINTNGTENELSAAADDAQIAQDPLNGGIDLRAKSRLVSVEQRGKGLDMKIDRAMIERYKREGMSGLAPKVTGFTPIESVLPIFGLNPA